MSLSPDVKLLQLLFEAAPEALSPATLAQRARLSESDLQLRIGKLQLVGYDIELHPHKGYSLRGAADVLIADEILARLGEKIPGLSVLVFNETRSTNDLAHRHGREGHPGPLLILAETQTHGRGRQGRAWNSSPRLGLWMSLLLRPEIPHLQTQRLTIQSCLALHRSIRKQCHIHADIKWPNDLLYKGKKIAGILAEAHLEGTTLRYAIVGIGCNIHHQLKDFPQELQSIAGSLALAGGNKLRRIDLLLEFLNQFHQVQLETWDAVRDEWKAHCLNMGQSITMQLRGQIITGQMMDMDEDGALLFRHASGTLEIIHTGEILP